MSGSGVKPKAGFVRASPGRGPAPRVQAQAVVEPAPAPVAIDDRRFSTISLVDAIKQQDATKVDLLTKAQKALYELKREISAASKKNFALERDVRQLDKKIALLIRNRITVEEVMATTGDLIDAFSRTGSIKDKREKEYYGQLFYMLQHDTKYMSTLARLVKIGEIDNLLQTVMFTLYGNQYEENEEHLLLSMFQTVLQRDFQESSGLGSLLRANTALTRMMSTYTRRGPGQQYLKQTLSKLLVNTTVERKDLCLEINPAKVYEAWIIEYETGSGKTFPYNRKPEPEEAAKNAHVKEVLAPRVKMLEHLSEQFVEAIIKSTDLVPYGIRWICKQIRELTKAKYPQATRAQVCSLVGGFFLLRFVNPAIVTPQAFMLVDAKLTTNARRNLTLLAKVLQNLANNATFGGIKEEFMEPMNPFLERCRDKLNDFLEGLTRVDNLNDHLQLDKYLAMGKTSDVVISISLNEMYFVHQLMLQHRDVLAPPNDPLLEIMRDLGPAPPQLPRGENATVELKLTSRFETNDDSRGMRPERMYNETKYLLFSMLHVLPTLTREGEADMKTHIDTLARWALDKKDPDLIDRTKRIIANCRKLVHDGLLSEADGYRTLRSDIITEYLNYDNQVLKANQDIEKLKQVREAISEHNKFLQGQLATYEQYRKNVLTSVGTSGQISSASSGIASIDMDKAKVKDKAVKKRLPVKFSHVQLEKDGIIIASEVPDERRGSILFSFSTSNPGVFDVVVMYKSRVINEMRLQLDELLERQHSNQLELETDFLKLNVNLLIYLLNKTFIS